MYPKQFGKYGGESTGRSQRNDGSMDDTGLEGFDATGYVARGLSGSGHNSGAYRGSQFGLVPAIAAPLISKVAPKISFKTPSDKRAERVLGGVVSAANSGNLNAVAILDTRRNIGIAAERAVWAKGYAQLSSAVLAAYTPNRAAIIAAIPASAQKSPEAAAAWATGTPYTGSKSTIQQISDAVVPVLLDTEAGRELQSAVVKSAVQSNLDTAKASVSDAAGKYWPVLAIGVALLLLKGRR